MGVHFILGYLVRGAFYPWIFGTGMHFILGYLVQGCILS